MTAAPLAERCTIETAQLILGLKRRNIQAMAARGAIPGAEQRADGEWLFDVARLRAFIKESERTPKPRPCLTCLYRHFDDSGRLLYVGISIGVLQRLSGHKSTSHWFDKITRIEIERFPNREYAEAAELDAIWTENPLYNVAGRAAA
jgi:hypothetical protein